MINEIVLATKNKGKLMEFIAMLNDHGIDIPVISLLDIPNAPEVVESGKTFKENAYIKAKTICSYTNLVTLADDSGLEVDYLNGAPGIYSARFAGEPKSDERNNEKLLNLLKDVPKEKRGARFRCALCIMTPWGDYYETDGTCEGIINTEACGEQGFGYDPLFYLPEYKLTMAQLSPEIKNSISHRSKAFKEAIKIFSKLLLEHK